MNNAEYTKRITVTTYDCDRHMNIKMSAVLRHMQEAGEEQLRPLGHDYSELFKKNQVFIATKAAILIHKAPVLKQEIDITTWHRGSKGVQFFRDFAFCDTDGNIVLESTSSWVLVDSRDGKILRPNAFDSNLTAQPGRVSGSDSLIKRTAAPNDMEPVGERTVRYSDIDYNQHMNNTVYADIVYDFLPDGAQEKLKSFVIGFERENKLGDTISVLRKQTEGGIFVQGNNSFGRSFTAQAAI